MGRRIKKPRRGENDNELPIPPEAATTSSSSPSPPWIELPEDVTANILQRLGAVEILLVADSVCSTWRKVCKDPAMWRVIDLMNSLDSTVGFDLMCRRAVDRSQGQLVDLNIAYFGDDDLLSYVADRSSNLRCLTLTNRTNISGSALSEAVKKLPQLEELHLILMSSVSAKDLENIGFSCPMLKSFTYNLHWTRDPNTEEHSSAIGKAMPNLRRLRLYAHSMLNEGLEAILDGCPHLEYLDLRRCLSLDLQGALLERCSKQIKELRLPRDSFDDLNHPIMRTSVMIIRNAVMRIMSGPADALIYPRVLQRFIWLSQSNVYSLFGPIE